MSLRKDIEENFRRLMEKVDRVSDKEAEEDFNDLEDQDLDNDGDTDSSDKYLHKRLGMVAKMDENNLGIDEPYYVEISNRDARAAVEAIHNDYILRNALKREDLVTYGSNVFATKDQELFNTLSRVLEDNNIELYSSSVNEMSTTASVPGFDSPYAFGKVDKDTIEQGGMKSVKKTNRIFKQMESKSSQYKKMMSEMYGVKSSITESSNPEMDELVTAFVDKIADRNGYPTSEAIIAIFEALKRKGFLHKSVEYKSPSGYSIDEAVSYREYKKDESATPSQKVNKSIMEVNRMLAEIERVVAHNLKLKNESGVNSNQFWKSTGVRFSKINERIVRISNRLKELSK